MLCFLLAGIKRRKHLGVSTVFPCPLCIRVLDIDHLLVSLHLLYLVDWFTGSVEISILSVAGHDLYLMSDTNENFFLLHFLDSTFFSYHESSSCNTVMNPAAAIETRITELEPYEYVSISFAVIRKKAKESV